MSEQLDNWRNELYASGNFNREELNELESHLIDEMDHVKVSSLTEKEKMLVAEHRLGSVNVLNKAYSKKSWISQTHLSWSLQMLMAYFIFREVVMLMTYTAADMIDTIGITSSIFKYSTSIGLEALGLVMLAFFLRYIIKLNYKSQSLVKPNMIMAVTCASMLLLRILYFAFMGNPMIIYESILVSQLFSYIPIIFAISAIIILSLKGRKKKQIQVA